MDSGKLIAPSRAKPAKAQAFIVENMFLGNERGDFFHIDRERTYRGWVVTADSGRKNIRSRGR